MLSIDKGIPIPGIKQNQKIQKNARLAFRHAVKQRKIKTIPKEIIKAARVGRQRVLPDHLDNLPEVCLFSLDRKIGFQYSGGQYHTHLRTVERFIVLLPIRRLGSSRRYGFFFLVKIIKESMK